MRKTVSIFVAAAMAIAVDGNSALGQRTVSRTPAGEVGRYQLVRVSEMHVYLIDTATGQCWSQMRDGEWRDEGNPARPVMRKPAQSKRPTGTLDLPQKTVELIVLQREERAIPGSNGSIRIRLGDITEGQVLLSVKADDDEYLLERTSVSQGDNVEFSVGAKKYTVRIDEIRNILIGDDFAKITVAEAGE